MNPAEVALAQLDVLLDEQEAAATPPGPPAAARPTRRRIGNPTNEAPASLPAAAAAALRRRASTSPRRTPAEPAEPEEQPAQLRCSKRLPRRAGAGRGVRSGCRGRGAVGRGNGIPASLLKLLSNRMACTTRSHGPTATTKIGFAPRAGRARSLSGGGPLRRLP